MCLCCRLQLFSSSGGQTTNGGGQQDVVNAAGKRESSFIRNFCLPIAVEADCLSTLCIDGSSFIEIMSTWWRCI